MKVLIAEDDEITRRTLESLLAQWGYQAIGCATGVEALEILTGGEPPELAVLDWMMPEMDGVEVCRKIRESKEIPFVYVVILTAKDKQSDIVAGMEAGADDFLTKPFDDSELQARLRAGQRIIELKNRLQFVAARDQLTDTWNHGAIFQHLDREMIRAQREGRCVAVLLADLDRFKKINDTYGHLVGDEVLQEVVQRMSSVLRPYDFIGRYGGEEFLILAPMQGDDPSVLRSLSKRLLRAVSETPVVTSAAKIPVTISIGGVMTEKGGNQTQREIVGLADEYLYRAKRAGRNRAETAS